MKQTTSAIWEFIVRSHLIRMTGIVLIVFAAVIALIGFLNQHAIENLGDSIDNLLGDFYANVSTELVSIAITVLIIDTLYQRREINREKRDLILQLGSPDNAFSREALRKIRARKWLNDGSLSGAFLLDAKLEGADLMNANLRHAKLINAKLEGADLRFAKLEGVNLIHADLRGANLIRAKLEGADLSHAKLEGADLGDADLKDADLTNAEVEDSQLATAKSLEGATMPDGTIYDGRFDKKDE